MTDEQLERLLVLDGAPGPALVIDAAHGNAMIDAALTGAGFGPGGAGGTHGASGGSGGAGGALGGTKIALLGAAAVVVVAIALLAWRARHGQPHQLQALIADAPMIDAPLGTGTATDHADNTAQDAPSADPSTAPPDEPPTVALSDIEVPPDPTPARRKHDTAAVAHETVADLLGAANAKRVEKAWRESDELYARVVQRAPKSLAAQTALVASASLHLEHLSDPKGAAQRFRRALAIAPTGALAEDARWGLAEAARANHDAAAEKAALDDFIAHHAASPLAERAKARRAELP